MALLGRFSLLKYIIFRTGIASTPHPKLSSFFFRWWWHQPHKSKILRHASCGLTLSLSHLSCVLCKCHTTSGRRAFACTLSVAFPAFPFCCSNPTKVVRANKAEAWNLISAQLLTAAAAAGLLQSWSSEPSPHQLRPMKTLVVVESSYFWREAAPIVWFMGWQLRLKGVCNTHRENWISRCLTEPICRVCKNGS